MIKGVHTMFYSTDASGLRAFIRDKLGFSATDVGDGWLIFNVPEADMGCHPTEEDAGPKSGDADISFYCDDIESTVADLKQKQVQHKRDNGSGTAGLLRQAQHKQGKSSG